jgi:hypothetical protein
MRVTEPWGSFGPDQDTPGLPAVLVARAFRAEEREAKREQAALNAKRADAEDRREVHLHYFLQDQLLRAQMDPLRAEGVNPLDPRTFVETPEQVEERIAQAEDAEVAAAQRREDFALGRLHRLNIPPSEMVPARPESSAEVEELADAWAGRARRRTEHEALRSRIKHGLKRMVGA